MNEWQASGNREVGSEPHSQGMDGYVRWARGG